jgi:hypothetical protein
MNRINFSKKINIKEFLKSMPKDCFNEPQNFSDRSEWRIRFLKINDKKYVEISIKKNNVRKFFNTNGDLIYFNVNSKYDSMVQKEYYFYTKDN